MGTEERQGARDEREPPDDALVHSGHAEVAPFVWFWDGERWAGPEGSGDYPAAESQSRSRS